MAFVESIRKSFSRHRRRDVAQSEAAEASGADQRPSADSITCVVAMLDESEASFEIEKSSTVNDLLSDVSNFLSLREMDYFGFSYEDDNGLLCWLHDYKSIAKQMPGAPPYRFTFGVRFYMSNPSQLREDVTRYQFCLQVRSDLYKGRVAAKSDEIAEIAALSLQSELGDFDGSIHVGGYERNFELVPNQEDLNVYEKIVELHKEQDGLLPFEAELRLLNIIEGLKGYGVRSFVCTDGRGQSLRAEISYAGLLVHQADSSLPLHSWRTVVKISHRRKKVTCKFQREGDGPTVTQLHFPTKRAAKEAWKSFLEHHDFFSMELPSPKPKFLSSMLRGSTFRYSGRTQYQIKRMEDFDIRPNKSINRIGSVRRSTRKPPQRSASSASSRRTDVAITVARSHSLSGVTKISSNGVKIPLEEMMRNRTADRSLDSSMQDVTSVAPDQDKASMLVHLGTPAPSTANIPHPLYTTVPGGDDDLEPDYQELNNATLKSRTAPALEPEGASLAAASEPPSPSLAGGRDSASPTARDPTTGEPMYNEIPNDIPKVSVPPAAVATSHTSVSSQATEDPNYEEVPEKPQSTSAAVDIVVTVSSPMGETKSVHSTSEGSGKTSPAASKVSVDKVAETSTEHSNTAADQSVAAAPKASHVYSMPTPRSERGGSDNDEAPSLGGSTHGLSGSQGHLISPDVMELMAELGIEENEKKDEDDDVQKENDDKDEEDGGSAEPDTFEADPFSQPDATQYAVGERCVSPISGSGLAE
ncbi:FERM domain-containing protein 5-like [Sycon ciliatum]|uniref:FERM domain-containing protein 5-like n=1 Tax=Sycon ciliatum TaxID=27933 RepID=UPI0031F60A3B